MRTPPLPVIGSAVLTFGSLAYIGFNVSVQYHNILTIYGPATAATMGRFIVKFALLMGLLDGLPTVLALCGIRAGRTILSVVTGLGVILAAVAFTKTGTPMMPRDIIIWVAQFAAVALLYTRPANAFFKKSKPVVAPGLADTFS